MRKRERHEAEARKRDGIGAILEEVINRYESKIDLFCSGSVPVSAPLRSHTLQDASRSHPRESKSEKGSRGRSTRQDVDGGW